MKTSLFVLFILTFSALLLLSACSSAPAAPVRPSAPASYANKTNPLSSNTDAIAKGKAEYAINCSSCHGINGAGDGPAGAALSPKPTSLIKAVKEVSAGYFFWRTSDGGGMDPFKSSMPAFKGILSEEKIWQVFSYIQSLK